MTDEELGEHSLNECEEALDASLILNHPITEEEFKNSQRNIKSITEIM